MLQRIERHLRRDCGIRPGEMLIVGVSGGPDSLCLLHALHALGHRPLVAHFDHQLRTDSAADADHVARLASSLGLQFVAGREDVAAYSTSRRIAVEEAGRKLRYAFLLAQARVHAAVAVAVGHTADDQAETILMHLVRGAGLSGLTGMAHRVVLPEFDASIPIVRPLLGIWREQTLEYCRLHELPALHDTSNQSRGFLRNRVRLDLIPSLESYNPQVRQALWRLGHSATEDMALIEKLAADAWLRTLMSQGRGYLALDAAGLAAEPPALQRRLLMRAASTLQPDSEIGFDDLQRAELFIADRSSRRLELGDGLSLIRESQSIYVTLGELRLPSHQWPQLLRESIALGPGRAVMAPLADSWQFTADPSLDVHDPSGSPSPHDPFHGVLDADMLPLDLELRVPRAGDRIQPLGLKGHTQKLSDVFTNIGVPERLRQHWPVLASDNDVVWLPGFRIAEPYRVRKHTRRVLLVAVYRPD